MIRKYDKYHFLKIFMCLYCLLSYTLKYAPNSKDYNFYNPYKNYLIEISASSEDPYDKADTSNSGYSLLLEMYGK
jgi:hypothetical protein